MTVSTNQVLTYRDKLGLYKGWGRTQQNLANKTWDPMSRLFKHLANAEVNKNRRKSLVHQGGLAGQTIWHHLTTWNNQGSKKWPDQNHFSSCSKCIGFHHFSRAASHNLAFFLSSTAFAPCLCRAAMLSCFRFCSSATCQGSGHHRPHSAIPKRGSPGSPVAVRLLSKHGAITLRTTEDLGRSMGEPWEIFLCGFQPLKKKTNGFLWSCK